MGLKSPVVSIDILNSGNDILNPGNAAHPHLFSKRLVKEGGPR